MIRPALFAVLLLAASPLHAAQTLKLTVYHTNDIHGWIMPRPEKDSKRLIGGAAALGAVLAKDRGAKLLVDAGDWFQGTPEGTLSKGVAMADVFNALAYDAVTPGNHEFDLGEQNLQELIKAIHVPVLGANIYRDGRRVSYLRPWIVKEVGGVKIGIFGLLTVKMKGLAFPENIEGLEFRREIEEARQAVKALKKEGATVIIALSHIGFEQPDGPAFEGDQTLAASVAGIDLIVGGHSHTALIKPLREATYGTLIVQAGTALRSVGQTTLEIDRASGRVVSSNARLLELWLDETGEDPKAAGVVAEHAAAVGRVFETVVATAAVSLERNRDGESALGDWITDCSRSWAKTDIAMQNGGGIRADLGAGPITLRDIFNVMPFENRVVKLTMTGERVREALDLGMGAGRILQVSGVAVSYRRRAKAGRRVESVTVAGKPLDPAARYTVAALDFMVQGGDGYSPFALAEKTDYTKTLMRDVLGDCARSAPQLAAPQPGRLRPLD